MRLVAVLQIARALYEPLVHLCPLAGNTEITPSRLLGILRNGTPSNLGCSASLPHDEKAQETGCVLWLASRSCERVAAKAM